MTFEEAWEKFREETLKVMYISDKAIFRAGYEAAKKEPPRVVSFLED